MEEQVLEAVEPAPAPDYSLIKPFFRGLKPVRRITVSEWAETYRYLGKGVSKFHGWWSNNTTPYLIPIMDCLSVFSHFQKVVFMKGAQIAGTSAAENFIGYIIHISPAPTLVMYPTVSVAERNSKGRIGPLISDSPALRKIVPSTKSRDGNNTILEKQFPGGRIIFTGANSPSDLRSFNAKYVVQDEMDEYPNDLDGQGDPSELATVRTNTYDDDKKIFQLSTPKIKGTSHIQKAFEETDQHYCYLPCPHCAADAPLTKRDPESYFKSEPPPGYQQLVLEQFRFTPGRPELVFYECIHCKKEIHNHHKDFMLPRYVWVPSHPEKASKLRIGFHLNAFYSPLGFYSWPTMADRYETALREPNKMITFVQTTLGLPYEQDGEQPKHKELFARWVNSPYSVNQIHPEVCFLTAGIDVQNDRIEMEIVGWGKGKRSYSVDFRVLMGNPRESKVWNDLQAVLNEQWGRESDGFVFGINMAFIDEGHCKNEVYAFCLTQGLSRILPVKGMETQTIPISAPKPVYIMRDGKKDASLHHITINTDFYKTSLYGYLNLFPTDETGELGPVNYCHFPKEYQEEHYRRLVAEKKVSNVNRRGYEQSEWKKTYVRNEQLDCRVYAIAAAEIMGLSRFTDLDYDKMVGKVDAPKVIKKKPNNRNLPGLGKLPKM